MFSSDPDQALIQKAFVRVCRDSGYRVSAVDAAILVGQMLRLPGAGFSVMGAVGFDNMDKIAAGDHPACQHA